VYVIPLECSKKYVLDMPFYDTCREVILFLCDYKSFTEQEFTKGFYGYEK